MSDLNEICKMTLDVIEPNYTRTIFELWFKEMVLLSLEDDVATFGVNSEFKKKILENKYSGIIKESLAEATGLECEIKIEVVKPEGEEGKITLPKFTAVEEDRARIIEEERREAEKKDEVRRRIEGKSVVSDYTFDNFVVGSSNKFAHAAALSVASGLSSSYNPLFIYGPSGLGKTHLLYAITNEMKLRRPEIKIIYKRGEDFTNELIASISSGSTTAFRNRYRSADVLLIDDIQFIAGKESTQEEFFHTFNALYDAEKQIILTSDRPPKDIKTLEERLRTRFEWGLTADIQPPDFELRTAIINKKAESLHLTLDADITDFLAGKLDSNIRQIEGAIKKIAAVSLLTSTPVSKEMAQRAIADLLAGAVPPEVIVDNILREVSHAYSVSVEAIKGKKRNENIALARHVATYLVRQYTDLPLKSVGAVFNRDHSTTVSSVNKIRDMMDKNPTFANDINTLAEKIKQ